MRRFYWCSAAIGALSVAAYLLAQNSSTNLKPFAELTPAGPILYLEARDFAGLLRDWNASPVKADWLAGDNYSAFSRSRLFQKLEAAQAEFAATVTIAPEATFLNAVAGEQSALALYDIGDLEFLYMTRMPAAKAYETALWQARAKFQPRNSAGLPYYVAQDQRRAAAFAVVNDVLLLATQEDAIAGALALAAGQSRPSLAGEQWFKAAIATAQPGANDLRLCVNFERTLPSPYFRSYWVQRNTSDLRQFGSMIADLRRSPTEIRESRALLRREPGPSRAETEAAVAEALRYAPPDAGLVRAWAAPETADFARLAGEKLLGLRNATSVRNEIAPAGTLNDGTVGSEFDLETRIDEPPFSAALAVDVAPLAAAIGANRIAALAHLETTRTMRDGVFVDTRCALVAIGSGAWDAGAVRGAVAAILGPQVTAGGIGVEDGLAHITVVVDGRALVLSNSPELAKVVLARPGAARAGAAYFGRFLHSKELPQFERMMRMIDRPAYAPAEGQGAEPQFFAENLASFGRALRRVQSATIESHDSGTMLRQTVVYRMQ